ncbi:uncharacterized protein LOC131843164 [Achroia grisella]|uniref:uncharacterized protein LOC131843164 n=1 Tax=Achroia grisella TaxID=688607 RepID=UPI0027D34184|nr:uncharacterized protein LOC131843164 [Achroia grisella]
MRRNIILVSINFIIICAANSNITKSKEIEALEKEKSDLLQKINRAIDDSVKILETNNDNELQLGANHLKELKTLIKILNETEDVLTTELTREDSYSEFYNQRNMNNSSTDGRKSLHKTKKNKKELPFDLLDMTNLFPKKGNAKNNRTENILKIQSKLDQWILERKREKERIREHREKKRKLYKFEKCPRFGLSNGKNTLKRGTSKSRNYPCCRKCCKKSYMGCL